MEQIARGMEYYRHERQRQRERQARLGSCARRSALPCKDCCISTSPRLPQTC
jgi:hypothetical protein